MKHIAMLSLLLSIAFTPVSAHARSSGSHAHYANQGGHYAGGRGSSHKGGHYRNPRTHDHYTRHKH